VELYLGKGAFGYEENSPKVSFYNIGPISLALDRVKGDIDEGKLSPGVDLITPEFLLGRKVKTQ
jgi:hypothetical protein